MDVSVDRDMNAELADTDMDIDMVSLNGQYANISERWKI